MALKRLIIGMCETKYNNHLLPRLLIILIFFIETPSLISQIKNLSFSYFQRHREIVHGSLKPYLESHQAIINTDSSSRLKWIARKLYDENLFDFRENDIKLTIDPLFNFSFGLNEMNENYIFSNVRGLRITGDISQKFSFETRIYENQFIYPEYLKLKSKQRANNEKTIDAIAFGIGRAKNFKANGLDASLANGYLSFSPNESINFQLGHGRHFFGTGYRSLLISDYAPDYPYLSGQYYLFGKKVLYKHVYAWMSNLSRISASSNAESLFVPKAFSINQVSYQPNNKFSLSFFEGVIYKLFDTNEGRVYPEMSFYIPLFGLSALKNNNSSNLIYGINWDLKFFSRFQLYNQFSFNGFNMPGMQAGINFMDPFNLNRSFLNLEFNAIPNTFYSVSSSNIFQRYSHLGHELAHPLGSGFKEIVLKGQLSFKSFFIRFNQNFVKQSKSKDQNFYGYEVFTPVDDIVLNQLNFQNLIFLNNSLGFYFNSKTNMEVSLGHITRITSEKTENYLVLSWKTFLKNDYFDQ